jgi:hypothetical protein
MTGHLDLNQIQLAAIVQSAKGIISRIPRGLEKLKCVRITHLEGLEYLDVWATDRYCVLHLVIHCSAAAPAVDTCVDHSALAAALAELKASPLTRVKLSESEFTIDSVTTAQAFKLSPTQLPRIERLVQGGPALGDVHEGSMFNLGRTTKVAASVRLSDETAMEGREAPWEIAQKGVHPGKDGRLGTLYLRRGNRHRAGDPERESWMGVEYAEIWQGAIIPAT